jgi:hypothetical protein
MIAVDAGVAGVVGGGSDEALPKAPPPPPQPDRANTVASSTGRKSETHILPSTITQ